MNSQNPLVSIALCTFNGEKYIKHQLYSILNQTYLNIEVVIVDDCSTDATLTIIKEINDPRIKLNQNQQNLGFNENFIKAINLCSSDVIAIADQDDYWEKEKLVQLLPLMKDALLVYHNSNYMDEHGKLNGKSILSNHRFVKGLCSQRLLYNNCISGHTCIIKKELLSLMPPIPEGMYYDWWMAYTAGCLGRINFSRAALVNYRIHERSFTQNDKQNSRGLRLKNLLLFLNHPLTPTREQHFLRKLINGYNDLNTRCLSTNLMILLLLNYTKLFYTRKRSFFSNLKFIFKESIH